MRMMKSMILTALLLSAAACGKDKGGGDGKGGGGAKLDEAEAYFLKTVQDDIAEVKATLAKGEDPKYTCAGASAYADELKNKKNADAEAAVKELTQICTYEVPLAALEKAVAAAETARKAKPDEQMLSECYSAEQSMAMEELGKNFAADEKVKALAARWDAACPPKK